jgi:small-conductance mechanosensitive channel
VNLSDIIAPSEVSGWDIALAVIALVATWFAYRLASRATLAAMGRIRGLSDSLRTGIARAVKYLVLFIGIGVALAFLGAQIQPLIVMVIIVVVIVLLVVRGIADNFGAGLLIQTRQPIVVGDEVESHGYVGIVMEINGRSVVLRTGDGREVHLPNADVLRQPLVNNTHGAVRRSEVQVRCLLDDNEAIADRVEHLLALTSTATGVKQDPAPDCLVVTAETRRLTATIRFWHQPLDYLAVTSAVVVALGDDLRAHGGPATVTSDRPDPPLPPPAPA